MNFIDRVTPRRALVITERLKRLPWWGHQALRVAFRLEGMEGYVFGARAGPSIDFYNVAHEMGHAVQFGAENFAKRVNSVGSYVFRIHKVKVLGQFYPEPQTQQISMRELEVFAIQRHIVEMAGYRVDSAAYAEHADAVMKWLPDWYMFKEKTRARVIARRLDGFYAAWTKEAITREMTGWLDAVISRTRRGVASTRVGKCDIAFPARMETRATAKPREPEAPVVAAKRAFRPVPVVVKPTPLRVRQLEAA